MEKDHTEESLNVKDAEIAYLCLGLQENNNCSLAKLAIINDGKAFPVLEKPKEKKNIIKAYKKGLEIQLQDKPLEWWKRFKEMLRKEEKVDSIDSIFRKAFKQRGNLTKVAEQIPQLNEIPLTREEMFIIACEVECIKESNIGKKISSKDATEIAKKIIEFRTTGRTEKKIKSCPSSVQQPPRRLNLLARGRQASVSSGDRHDFYSSSPLRPENGSDDEEQDTCILSSVQDRVFQQGLRSTGPLDGIPVSNTDAGLTGLVRRDTIDPKTSQLPASTENRRQHARRAPVKRDFWKRLLKLLIIDACLAMLLVAAFPEGISLVLGLTFSETTFSALFLELFVTLAVSTLILWALVAGMKYFVAQRQEPVRRDPIEPQRSSKVVPQNSRIGNALSSSYIPMKGAHERSRERADDRLIEDREAIVQNLRSSRQS